MPKKLPNIYVNKTMKSFQNNSKAFYSGLNISRNEPDLINNYSYNDNINIYEKINKMFHSPNYVYKMNATIKTKDGRNVNKDVIGKVDNKLLTLDESLIPIDDIEDIRY